MNKNQQVTLVEKLKQLHLKLEAQTAIFQRIQFHWLGYFKTIKQLGIFYRIDYLCTATHEELPHYTAAIEKLNMPDLSTAPIKPAGEGLWQKVFDKYPSTSAFKYVMDLPLLDAYKTDVSAMLQKAADVLMIKEALVFFLSPDCSPVLELKWNELLKHGSDIFDDSCISLVFTDVDFSWIIFRSIENEWRCGFTGQNNEPNLS